MERFDGEEVEVMNEEKGVLWWEMRMLQNLEEDADGRRCRKEKGASTDIYQKILTTHKSSTNASTHG